jgi:outer membrane protein assembly factor BamB
MTVDGAKQLVAQSEKTLAGIAVADGKPLWQVPTPVEGRVYNSATPLVDGQTLMYTGQGKGTRAAKVEKQGDGFALKDLWTNDKAGTGYNTPVLKDGYLYGFSTSGNFWCLDAKTGQEAWTDGASRDRSGFGSIVDAGAALVALPSSSELTVFKPSAKGYEELARIKVSAEATYAHPVLAGKRIYVKDKETLTAWTVE